MFFFLVCYSIYVHIRAARISEGESYTKAPRGQAMARCQRSTWKIPGPKMDDWG